MENRRHAGDAAYHEIPASSKQAADLKTRLAIETQTGQTPLARVVARCV